MMLHIIGTMMSTGMTRAVFIKTVKNLDFFGGLDDEEEETKKESKKKNWEAHIKANTYLGLNNFLTNLG